MSMLYLSMNVAMFGVDCLFALVAVARVLPVDRRAGLFLLIASMSSALSIAGAVLAEVGALGALVWQGNQGTTPDLWFLGYGLGAMLLIQVPPAAHAAAVAAAGYALLSMSFQIPVQESATS